MEYDIFDLPNTLNMAIKGHNQMIKKSHKPMLRIKSKTVENTESNHAIRNLKTVKSANAVLNEDIKLTSRYNKKSL
jgi:hypothetical protein